ncbi:hypothetical protein BDP27DRAFT_1424898 [Rhodocollybia butyracea]|uniref:Uncharacterized protein n=1 Tax=Rhodocollybia butyracea TaxID=206335 RepID=A0A9P5U3W4_9AGAR|nr:hypothetical protein BDP27DRAFT_1424898 [Rhodocollybia butyracea]
MGGGNTVRKRINETSEEHGSVIATGFSYGPACFTSQRSLPLGPRQQQQPHRSSPRIFTASLHNPEALPLTVPTAPQTAPEPSSNEASVDKLDFNQPSTLEMYTKVVLFKSDLTCTEMVCSTPTPQEYHVVELIAQKLGLHHYSVRERSTIVTRPPLRKESPTSGKAIFA